MPVIVVLLAAMVPAASSAQRPPEARVGIGLTTTDGLARWGKHALLELELPVTSRFTVRPSGFLSFGDELGPDRSFSEGLDLNLVVQAVDRSIRQYCGVGLGYVHTPLSAAMPFRHDLGVGGVVGVELPGAGGLFVEGRLRYFGNVFFRRASTRSLLLITVGRRLGGW